MIFPRQDAVYQNLNTSFTNFGELLVDLKENSFTGCVEVSYWEYAGTLLLDSGNIVNALEEIDDSVISGQDAVKRVTSKAKEKDGAVSVYALKGEMITMLASVVKSQVVYENLSTEFTSLEALITKLQNEEHTGFIKVSFLEKQQSGYIFLLTGKVIESILSVGGDEISGQRVLPRIIELASSSGATFSVYKSAVEEALSESEVIMVSFNLPQLLEVWGAVIGAVESAADDLLSRGIFLNTFKDTLIAKADEYPFLDPFAAIFLYQDGIVSFNGEVKKNFSQGVGECLYGTIVTLAEQAALEGKDLFGSLRTAVNSVKTDYSEQIDLFNFNALLPDIFE
ncbi:MAG: hypothetical protein WBB69_00320 [Anaerolineales bacterium]